MDLWKFVLPKNIALQKKFVFQLKCSLQFKIDVFLNENFDIEWKFGLELQFIWFIKIKFILNNCLYQLNIKYLLNSDEISCFNKYSLVKKLFKL